MCEQPFNQKLGLELTMLTDLPQDIARLRAITAASKRRIWRTEILPLINADLVEEHREKPHGRHSSHLDMVLNFLRDDPLPERPRLVGVILKPGQQWAIGEHPRRRGLPVFVRPSPVFSSLDDIEHAVFLERLLAVKDAFGSEAARR